MYRQAEDRTDPEDWCSRDCVVPRFVVFAGVSNVDRRCGQSQEVRQHLGF